MHPRLQLGVVVAQLADPQLRARQVAEHRDLAADPLGGLADRPSIVCAWRSGPAWEKLRRKTSVPASIICSSTPGDQLAGPTVATILVRRGRWAAALAIGLEFISQ